MEVMTRRKCLWSTILWRIFFKLNVVSDCFWMLQILALLVRYHRKKVPSQKDEDFANLPDEVSVSSVVLLFREPRHLPFLWKRSS